MVQTVALSLSLMALPDIAARKRHGARGTGVTLQQHANQPALRQCHTTVTSTCTSRMSPGPVTCRQRVIVPRCKITGCKRAQERQTGGVRRDLRGNLHDHGYAGSFSVGHIGDRVRSNSGLDRGGDLSDNASTASLEGTTPCTAAVTVNEAR